MKIGYYVTRFPYTQRDEKLIAQYDWGGGNIAAYNLAMCMVRRGHEVNVFTSSADSNDSIETYNGMIVYRYGAKLKIGSASIPLNIFRKPLDYPVDIIHAHHTVPPASYAALWHARRKKVPFILSYHTRQVTSWGGIIRRTGAFFDNMLLARILLPSAKLVILPSEYFISESTFLRRYKSKIVSIPNGVNTTDFDIPYSKEECRKILGLPTHNKIVLFVGSLSPHKRPDILLKAMPIILRSVPDVIAVLVGNGILRDKLEKLAKKLGIYKFTKFVGFVPDKSISLYYKSADVFVLPSIAETFGIVLLEASASGLPLVVSDLKVFKTIVEDGYNGLVVKKGDEGELAQAIIRLFCDSQLRSMMSRNARIKASAFSWETIAEETERLYLAILKCEG